MKFYDKRDYCKTKVQCVFGSRCANERNKIIENKFYYDVEYKLNYICKMNWIFSHRKAYSKWDYASGFRYKLEN